MQRTYRRLMAWYIDDRFDIPLNRDVLKFLRTSNVSAHSDVASELTDAVAPLPGTSTYCPDSARYAFVVAHTADDRIFGLAYGLKAFALRIGLEVGREAERDGCTKSPMGDEWVEFDPFRTDVKTDAMRRVLRGWTARAFAYVTSL